MTTFLYFLKKVNGLPGCHYEVISRFAYLPWGLSSVGFASLINLAAIASALC